jgi:hypothetical protein
MKREGFRGIPSRFVKFQNGNSSGNFSIFELWTRETVLGTTSFEKGYRLHLLIQRGDGQECRDSVSNCP